MAVREFNGTTDYVRVSIGGLGATTYGTFAGLFKVADDTTVRCAMIFLDSGTTIAWAPGLTTLDDDTLDMWNGSNSANLGSAAPQDTWILVVVRKASGTATPRYSIYNYTTTSWTHTNATAAIANGPAPTSGFVNTASNGTNAEAFDGRLAVTAVWSNTVKWAADSSGDAALVAAGLHTSLAGWVSAAPTALWRWDGTVGSGITDLMVGGANQVAISGTTQILGDDPAGFSFELGPTSDPNQQLLRPFAAPVPRLFRTGIRVPFQLLGDDSASVVTAFNISLSDTAAAVDAATVTAAASLDQFAIATNDLTVTAAVPVADTATAADSLTVLATISLADTAAAVDAVTITTAAVLADTATAADAATVTAAVPLADTATAADALTAGVPIPLTDTATAADVLTSSAAVPLADTAAATDALSVFAPTVVDPNQFVPGRAPMFYDLGKAAQLGGSTATEAPNTPSLPDTATAADALTVTAAAPLTDTAAASDAATVTVAASLTDTAAAADALTATATFNLTDTAAATDALSVFAPGVTDPNQVGIQIPGMFLAPNLAAFQLQGSSQAAASVTPNLPDTATATDVLTVTAAVPLTDAGAAAETFTAGTATTLADTASAADSLTVQVAAPLPDTAVASDVLAVTGSSNPNIGDTATATDTLTVTATAPLTDTATAADVLQAGIPKALADTAAAADLLAREIAVFLSDTAACADALTVTVAAPLADTAAGSDTLTLTAARTITDTATATDLLSVAQVLLFEGSVTGGTTGGPSATGGTKAGPKVTGETDTGHLTGGRQ